MSKVSKIKVFLKDNWLLILIIVLAAFLRFYKLSAIPPGLFPDEAANGQDVVRIIKNHNFQAIYNTNGPREALFLYSQAIFVWLGDILNIQSLEYTVLALRIAPAVIGVLTVWAVYLMAKELFKNKDIGLFAAMMMAISSWHIHFSRNAFRAIMLPLTLCLMFYFFIRAYRQGKLKDYIWFGVFLAASFYTYLSARMIPIVFVVFIIWTLMFDKKFLKDNLKKILYSILAFTVLMIPIFISFIKDPSLVVGRASTSIFNPDLNNGSALLTFLDNIKKEILMFNFSGDENFRHNLGGTPMLDIISGTLMWIGAAISIFKWKKLENTILLSAFGAMSLPMILTAEGIPHALRVVGVMPVIFIWMALGLDFILKKIDKKNLKWAVLIVLFLIAGLLNFKKFFVDFPNKTETHQAYAEDMVNVAQDLIANGHDKENILIMGEFGTKTIDYLLTDKDVDYQRLETYEIKDKFSVPLDQNFNIYIQEDWFEESQRLIHEKGYWFNFEPVKSNFDGRTLYYVYKNPRNN